MLFKIESTNWWKIDELVEHYPCLTKFGLMIDKRVEPRICKIKDENGEPMDFQYGENITYTPQITINSIEELVEFTKTVDCCIVFDGRDNVIEIYDGYRE